MIENPYQPPKFTMKKETGKFKLCSPGIGLSIVAASLFLPATYLFGNVFFGKLFNQAPILILIMVAVVIFYIIISKVCRIREK